MKANTITVDGCSGVYKEILASAHGKNCSKVLEAHIVIPDGAITYYVNGQAQVSLRQAVQHYNELPGGEMGNGGILPSERLGQLRVFFTMTQSICTLDCPENRELYRDTAKALDELNRRRLDEGSQAGAPKEEAGDAWKDYEDGCKALDAACRRDGITVRLGARTFGAVKKPKQPKKGKT